jgi:YVTN family beta-propeller protein
MARIAPVLVGIIFAAALVGRSGAERAGAVGPAEVALPTSLRRPVSLTLADKGKWLLVANQRSGSVSVIDTASLAVVGEVAVGRKVSDLAITKDGTHLLVLDEDAGDVVCFRRSGSRLEGAVRVHVGPSPVSLRIAADGTRCSVASLWPRRLTVVELPMGGGRDGELRPRVLRTVDVDFAPRLQLIVPDTDKVIVADSFGGRLAVIDLRRGVLESDRLLPAHNIRGLALSADGTRLLVSHQVLNSRGTTSRDDIHWGNLITNCVRELKLAHVLDARAELLQGSRLHQLGDVGSGGGDPAGVAAGPSGTIVVALAGVGEVGIRGGKDGLWHRIAVGRRPTAVALSPDGRRAYVVNTLGDSVSVLDLEANRITAKVTLGPAPKQNLADEGELLFYDARLSHDGWFSCHSCHTDGHSNGLLTDTLGDGSHGTPKRVLTLLGVGDTGPWAWNGKMADLKAQVRASVSTTMHGSPLTPRQEDELTGYLRTLAPAPPRSRGSVEALAAGRDVFARHGCNNCHAPPSYTSAKSYDVGSGDGAFNPPSLRGVSQGGPYFHDGRAATLEEVFTRHRHQLEGDLSKHDLKALLTFLKSL